MSCCSVPAIKPGLLVLLFTALSAPSAWAASGSCAGLAAMPAAMEIDQGIQQNVRSSVAITRIAVGDPKIADVHVNGIDGFLLTGVAQGTTSLMVWTTCAS
ncbi:pilus assembly protein N-terminal domain-containing protein, partial [Pseudomonas syringae]